MNDLTAWTESGYYSPDPGLAADERFRNEPFVCVPPRRPPCDDCQHSARCARDNLACCAFAAYLSVGKAREGRLEHREPSAEWREFAALETPHAKAPHCEICKRKSPSALAAQLAEDRIGRSRILALLSDRPGLDAQEIADALGMMPRSVRAAAKRLEARGMIVSDRGKRGRFGHRILRWSVANG